MSEKAKIAAWIVSSMDARRLNRRRVALTIGVSPSTVSRWCDPEDPTMPSWPNVQALAEALGTTPPGTPQIPSQTPGMADSGLGPLPIEPSLPDWNGNISEWIVRDMSMQTLGYVKGDRVKADARIQPVDGDVVVANLYDTSGRARTVLRVFKSPGYLVPATADAGALEVHEAGKTAAVFGVVFESIRRRPSQ